VFHLTLYCTFTALVSCTRSGMVQELKEAIVDLLLAVARDGQARDE
jgi:hypothetical protein